jgi:hypothetical protein
MNSPLRLTFLLVLVGLLLPASLSGCNKEWREEMAARAEARKRAMTEKQLMERADEYWELVRWRSWSQASAYIQHDEGQLAFLRLNTDPGRTHPSVDDVTVRYVFIGKENPDEAELRVSWTEVDPTRGLVAPMQVTQRWYKDAGRWWVDAGQSLGLPDTPPPSQSPLDEEPPPDLPTETP